MYKEKIAGLMHACKNEPDDLDFIESRMSAFTDYMTHVAWMETRMQRMNIEGITGQEWRDQVTALDQSRRSKHNVAMDAINQLNRMSKACGLQPFYDGEVDHEHRTQIGDVIGDIVYEYFQGRAVGPLKQEDLMAADDFTAAVQSIQEPAGAIEQ